MNMRVEPHSIGSILHVIKRGARGMEIVRDNHDRFDFARSLFLLNDTYKNENWRGHVANKPLFYRPTAWPEREPLVSILAWTLLDNHLHLLIQENTEGNIAKFMQRLGGSMTLSFNQRYDGRGSIFQGSYKGRVVETDTYLQYVHAYIVVKNVFDMYPGGIGAALSNFENAWIFAEKYPFSSFLTAAKGNTSPILDMAAMDSLGLLRKDFKQYARSMLAVHAEAKVLDESLATLLEDW